jgi:hypothetical protein
MFDRSWIGDPCPSPFEYLMAFAVLFLAGSVWAACVRWYIEYRMDENAHA